MGKCESKSTSQTLNEEDFKILEILSWIEKKFGDMIKFFDNFSCNRLGLAKSNLNPHS